MSKKILIVDDSDDFRSLLKMTLEIEGFDVDDECNGKEGLEAAKRSKYDLIVSDIEMPVMGGLEFVSRFRDEVSRKTPIITLSAEDRNTMDRALQAGATETISKPFEPFVLIERVNKLLG